MNSRFPRALALVLAGVYPFLIFIALRRGCSVRVMALLFLVAMLAAFVRHQRVYLLAAGIVLTVVMVVLNSPRVALFYPVMMNGVMACVFSISLWHTPLIQIFAERMGETMNDAKRVYTRNVTRVWAGFLILNTAVSLATVFMRPALWTLYNGFIAYVLMGVLFVGEWLVRRRIHACS